MNNEEKKGNFGWAVLGFFFPVVGLILFFVWLNSNKADSKMAGLGALVSMIFGFVCSIIGVALVFYFGIWPAIQNGIVSDTCLTYGENYDAKYEDGKYYCINSETGEIIDITEEEEDETKPIIDSKEETNANCSDSCQDVQSSNKLHVFSSTVDKNGYDILAYLENQGNVSTIVDYKGELYYISGDQTDCMFDLGKGVKFKNNKAVCTDEDDNEGNIHRFNIKTSDVQNAYIIESYEANDGRDTVIIVFKDGTVNRYSFVDGGYVKKDFFKGYKVKEIIGYECSDAGENACSEEGFSLVLQDDSTEVVKKEIDY